MRTLKDYGQVITKHHKEQNASFLHSLLLSIVMIILFMHLTTNPYYQSNYITGGNGSGIIIAALGFTGIMYCLIMIYQANSLFLDQHQRMLGIMNLSGLRIFQSFRYISGISFAIGKRAIIGSICISVLLLPLINVLTNVLLGDLDLFQYRLDAYVQSLLALAILWLFMMLQNVGFVYRMDIKQLIAKTRAQENVIIEFPLSRIMALVFFLVPLFLLLYFKPADFYNIAKFTSVGVAGCLLMLTSFGINYIHKLQYAYRLHKRWNIVLGYVQVMLKQNGAFVMLVSTTTLALTLLLMLTFGYWPIFVSVLLIISAMMFMNMLSIQQSISLRQDALIQRSHVLSSLGYTKDEILDIVRWAYGLFFFLLYCSGYAFCTIGGALALYHQMISLAVFLLILILQIGFGCLGYTCAMHSYHRVQRNGGEEEWSM